jgi:hypothetical protein
MTDYAAVLAAIRPGAQWSLDGDDYAGLTWRDDTPKPTKDDLDAAWPAVQAELKWKAVRAERGRRLTAWDWTALADAPLNELEREIAANYRQALRDVPQDFDDPDAVVWPQEPA